MTLNSGALVLLSGGQDSTICLAWALERYTHVETVGIYYGQRHHVEMQARQQVLLAIRREYPTWAARLGQDHVLDMPVLATLNETAITSDAEIRINETGLPSTFVPGRNLLFLSVAAVLGYGRGLNVIVGGMCQTDFSGYPDCRDDAVKAQQVAMSLGMGKSFVFETPLMWLNKAHTWALAQKLGGNTLVDIVLRDTHTCYLGVRDRLYEWGYGCGTCPACALRRAGYLRWREQSKD